jgi:hypothetical protein
MRILIVADNASSQFGGEAFLPFNYFRLLRARNIDVRLLVHDRNRPGLAAQFPQDVDRLHYVKDTLLHRIVFRLGIFFPRRVADVTTGFFIYLTTQIAQRRLIRKLMKQHHFDVIHVPIPVSPKAPSLVYGFGRPVIFGPMNGGMEYPPPVFCWSRTAELETLCLVARRVAWLTWWRMEWISRFGAGTRFGSPPVDS